MQRYESPILSSVAYPPLVIFAPWKAVIGNFIANMLAFLFSGAFTDIWPWVWLVTFAVGHLVLIWANSKDPHMISLYEARFQKGKKTSGRLSMPTKNLVKAEGRKYVP